MRCEDKKRYLDEHAASVAVDWIRRNRMSTGPAFDPFHETLNAYVCPRCAYWHVGHDKRRMHELGPLVVPGRDSRKAVKKAVKKAARKARKAAKIQSRANRSTVKAKAIRAKSCYEMMVKKRIIVMA